MNRLFLRTICLACLLALSCGKIEQTDATGETPDSAAGPIAASNYFDLSTGTASITGKVTFSGTPPAEPVISMSADPVCMSLHKDPVYAQEVVVNNGNLENVFVYVKEGLEKYAFRPPSTPGEIDQNGCQYVPHVGGIMVGQKLRMVNSDPTLHNIHCVAAGNPQFNIGQPLKGMESERTFARPEVMMRFKCDVHKWMSCYLGVVPHPYFAVTGKDGSFSLKNLPPGEYVIEAWHEKLGTQIQKVIVGDKQTQEISFTFKAS